MNKVQIEARTDAEGSIRIRLPGPPRRCAVRVTVEWEELASASEEGWPAGWFEATAGCIDDDTFIRPPQGAFESRDKLP